MRPRQASVVTAGICIALWCIAVADRASCQSSSSEIIDFIRAENADTVSFQEKVTFISPSGEEITPSPGTYRVESAGPSALRLVPLDKKDVFVIKAQSRRHEEDVGNPVALIAVDEEDLVHVVLLLPGEKGLEAIGSSSRGRHRGAPQLLPPAQIHDALTRKNGRGRAPQP